MAFLAPWRLMIFGCGLVARLQAGEHGGQRFGPGPQRRETGGLPGGDEAREDNTQSRQVIRQVRAELEELLRILRR